MPAVLKVFAWIFLALAAMSLMCTPLAFADGKGDVAVTFVVFSGVLAIPGITLMMAGRKLQRRDHTQQMMVAFVRTRDAFTVEELAVHLGCAPGEAQILLNQDIARYRLPLVVHQASRRYLRLDRLQNPAQIASHCQSCGAAIGQQIVFAGEQLRCSHCGSEVQTHAPAPVEQQWQPPPQAGHWAQAPWSQPGPAPAPAPGNWSQPGQQQPGHGNWRPPGT